MIKRIRELPEESVKGTHYTQTDMIRRMKAYRIANQSEVAEPSVQDFFNVPKSDLPKVEEVVEEPKEEPKEGEDKPKPKKPKVL